MLGVNVPKISGQISINNGHEKLLQTKPFQPSNLITIQAQNLSFSVPKHASCVTCCDTNAKTNNEKNKQILFNINAAFLPGSMTALMGPSGAGKTTLLNVLSGRAKGEVTGEVLINNKPMQPRSLKMKSNFIPQDDILLTSLTVVETLMYAANLRLPGKMTAAERKERVELLLQKLSLGDCRNTRIGTPLSRGISGGQRKRVSVALELLTDPAVLFVDEPTSGLDASTAFDVIKILSNLAHEINRTIIVTIHQPSAKIFNLFDKLLLLSKGCTVYHGAITDVLPYFTKIGYTCPQYENPADFCLDILSITQNDNSSITEKWINSEENIKQTDNVTLHGNINIDTKHNQYNGIDRTIRTPSKTHANMLEQMNTYSGYPTTCIRQTSILFKRALHTSVLDPGQMPIRLLTTICVALLVGAVYSGAGDTLQKNTHDIESMLFTATFFSVMDSCLATITFFPQERCILLREYHNGYYRILAYSSSRILVTLLLQLIYSFMFSLILHSWVGIGKFSEAPWLETYGPFFGTIVLLGMIGSLLGLTIGASVPNANFAQMLVPPIMLPLIIFSGFLVQPSSIKLPFKWIYHISFFQYAFQNSIIYEYQTGYFSDCSMELFQMGKCPFGAGVKPANKVLENLNYNTSDINRNWYINIGYTLLLLLASYLNMKRNTRV